MRIKCIKCKLTENKQKSILDISKRTWISRGTECRMRENNLVHDNN